ncbi:uncharacterized protein LOC144163043 isoform X1 [Haemaphysalis longicornis]
MAPTYTQRSRKRRAPTLKMTEARKNCEVAARHVTAGRLTRPVDQSFRNQRESLRASRDVAGPSNVGRHVERDLLSFVREVRENCAGSRRSPPPWEERRGHAHGGGSRRERRSPSPWTSSSSDQGARRHERRRRKHRQRSRSQRDASSGRQGAPVAAPPPRAPQPPVVRRVAQRPPSVGSPAGGVLRLSGGGHSSEPRRASCPLEAEKEEQVVSQSISQLQSALNEKFRRLATGSSVLDDVRRFLEEVCLEAQREEPEDVAISEADQMCHPDLVASSQDESEMDFVLMTDSPHGSAGQQSPAGSFLPDSPKGEVPLFEEVRLLEQEEQEEEEEFLHPAPAEEGDDVGLAGSSGELWPVLSGSSTSSFIVPWDPEALFSPARGPEPSAARRSPPPPAREEWRREEHVTHAPYVVRLQPAAQPPLPPARWIGDAGLMTASPTTWVRSGWSSPWMRHRHRSPPLRQPPTPPRRQLSPPPPILPPREHWGQRTCEEFIPEPMEPLDWRPPRRCFSPCADRLRPAFINETAGPSADVARVWRFTPHNMF